MIIPINSIDEINKIVRNEIIKQSELPSERVLNGISLHGQDLVDKINDYAYKSYDQNNSLIVFDLSLTNSENDISQTLENGKIQIYSTYSMKCYVYGYSSKQLVLKTISRLRSEESRQNLYEQGVHLISINDIVDGKEFFNETMYIRTDFTINVSIMSIYNKVETDSDLTTFDINILEAN